MKTWRELTITSRNMNAEALIGLLRVFGSTGHEWAYSEGMSCDHAKSLNLPACIVKYAGSDAPREPLVALAATDDNRAALRLGSIQVNTMDEYNRIAARFAQDVRCWARATGVEICVKLGSTDVGLEQLIPCRTARSFFERYVERCRFFGCVATHPLDLELLDCFTCALHIYSRKPVDLCELERYLREDCLWSKADSRRCIARIEIGRDVLRLYNPHRSDRRFHRGWLAPRN